MLVPMHEILSDALEGNYAIAAPNVWNDWTTRAAIDAAESLNSPLILDYAYTPNVYYWMDFAKQWSESARVPIAINLDHGATFEHAMSCIHAGFSSIMVDRSAESFEKNVSDVAELVKIAHSIGVTVEAELGYVGQASLGDEDNVKHYTDPKLAKEYVERTDVDCLAVSIGNAHGKYNKGKIPKIRLDIIEEIENEIDIPLVLHGGSGTSKEDFIKLSRETNITKVNLFTDIHDDVLQKLNNTKTFETSLPDVDMKGYFYYRDKVEEYIKLLGSVNMAKNYKVTGPYKREEIGVFEIK